MMDMGFLTEVEALLAAGVPRDCRPMQAPGYLQLVAVIDGKIELEEAILQIQQAHRRYAKRQMTWLNKTPGVEWVNPNDPSLTKELSKWFNTP